MRASKKDLFSPYYRLVFRVLHGVKTKKRKLTRVTKTRGLWEQMEKSGESCETWKKQGIKAPMEPRKPKPALKNKRGAVKKAEKKCEHQKRDLEQSVLLRNEAKRTAQNRSRQENS